MPYLPRSKEDSVTKLLRCLVVALFVATALFAIPPSASAIIPMCYDLPTCTFQGGTWTLSHPCRQGTYILYVYINAAGDWCLYGPVMP
jgi:hypothetical protein